MNVVSWTMRPRAIREPAQRRRRSISGAMDTFRKLLASLPERGVIYRSHIVNGVVAMS